MTRIPIERRRKSASVFERVFLSHLILIAAMFGAMVWLYHYLVGSSYRIILQHDPHVIIPVVLILIGIAGVLSAGLSRAIVLPIEKAGEQLASDGTPEQWPGLEEVETLLQQLAAWMEKRKPVETGADALDPGGTVRRHHPAEDERNREIFKSLLRPIGILANLVEEQLLATYDPAGSERIERMKEQIAYMLLLAKQGIGKDDGANG